ncbi:MAG: hypothetical protein QXX08_00165 [Candidatus Bathyarchaeia archaeon]
MHGGIGTEEKQMLLEDFNLWLRTGFTDAFRLKGHKFEKAENKGILVDGALFSEEEAKQIFMMITSPNPFERLNATIIILERKGILTKVLIALAILALIIIYVRVKR